MDSEFKGTPGPYHYIEEHDAVVDGDDNLLVVSGIAQPHGYIPPDDPSYANARLLAASLDLLQALQGVMKLIDDGWLVRDTMGDSEPGWAMRQIKPVQVLAGASTAIRKALGE